MGSIQRPISMNGVLEWRDETRGAAYPLARSIADNDLLLDAQFLSFDGFIPTLKAYVVKKGLLLLTVTLEKGDAVVELTSSVQTGARVPITVDRYYGFLVIGPGAVRLLAEGDTTTVQTRTKFAASTVVSVPLNGGVYSVDGSRGDITLTLAEQLRIATGNNYFELSAIAIPSKQETIKLTDTDSLIYGVTSKNKLVRIDVNTGTYAVMTDLDRTYLCLATTNTGKIYASTGTDLYDLSQLPATLIMPLAHGVNGLCYNEGVLYGAGGSMTVIDPVAKTETVIGTLNALCSAYPHTLVCQGDLTHGLASNLLFLTLQGTAYNGSYTADLLAEFNITTSVLRVVGEIKGSVPGSLVTALPGIYTLVNTPSKLFGWAYFLDALADPDPVEGNLALSLNVKLATAALVNLTNFDPLVGFIYGGARGNNVEIVVNTFQALKTINRQATNGNAIVIEDTDLLKLSNSRVGELTIEVPTVEGLTLARAKKYSNDP